MLFFPYVNKQKNCASIENYASSTAHPSQLSCSSSVDCLHSLFICQIFVNCRQWIVLLIDFLHPVENPVLSPFAIYCNIPLFHVNVCSFVFSTDCIKHFPSALSKIPCHRSSIFYICMTHDFVFSWKLSSVTKITFLSSLFAWSDLQ